MQTHDCLQGPRQQRRSHAWQTLLVLALLCSAFVVGAYLDGEPGISSAAEAEAYQRGWQEAHQAVESDTLARVRSAYGAGVRAAIVDQGETPEGVQLAQVCMAWWYEAPIDKKALRRKVCGGRP
jgi:hypothetical protein